MANIVSITELKIPPRAIMDGQFGAPLMDIHPLLTAEQVGPAALAGMASRSPARAAWQKLEIVFAKGPQPNTDTEIDTIGAAFESALPLQPSVQDYYKVRLALTCFDLYRRRAKHEDFTAAELRKYTRSVAAITTEVRHEMLARQQGLTVDQIGRRPDINQLRGIMSEGITITLLGRQGIAAQVSSSREEASDHRMYNHDAVVMNGNQKKPIDIKSGAKRTGANRNSGPEILGVRVAQLGEMACRRVRRMPRSQIRKTNLARFLNQGALDGPRALSRLIDDDMEQTLSPDDRRGMLLDYLGQEISRSLDRRPYFTS